MMILDIKPDELRGWRNLGREVDGDGVRSGAGVEDEAYLNGTWMLRGWVGVNNHSSSITVGREKNNIRDQCPNKLG